MSDPIKISVSHGPDKHSMDISPTETVGQLSLKLEELTGVPQSGQKIINRGKTLQDPEQTLSSSGLKNGSKLMLIGKKPNPEEDENFKRILEVEKKVEALMKKQAEIAEEITGVGMGYLQKDLEKESLSSLKKRLGGRHEDYVRLLEKLDAMELGGCNHAVRGKRKTVVMAIQKQLDVNDDLEAKIERLQNPDAS